MEVVQQSVDLAAVSPELILAGTACLVLLADLFLPREAKWLAMPLSAAGLFATLAAIVSLIGEERGTFAIDGVPTFVINPFALTFKGLFCILGLLILAVAFNYFKEGRYYQGEFYFLMLASLLGGLIMASARDLISLFIAIELITVPAIVMVAMRKRDTKSNEAALKFFLFGVLSSALMLFGMSLVYGLTGQTTLAGIRQALAAGQHPESAVILAVFFLVVGFGFKIAAVPFHFWAPDTYEGAPSPVAAFLATASKIGGFVGLLVLMFEAFPEVSDSWRPLFAIIAALTMSVGNLIALRQQHIIRLFAYSGIAQTGYMLVPFAVVSPGAETNQKALAAAIVYIVIYGLMDVGAFSAAVAFARRGGTYFISDYAGLWQRSPVLAVMMAAFLVSLAGVPPTAGLWAKLFILDAAISAQVYWIAVVVAVNAVIAAWYYLFVVKKMFFEPAELTDEVQVPFLLRAGMGLAALALVAAFIYPPLVTDLADRSAEASGGGNGVVLQVSR